MLGFNRTRDGQRSSCFASVLALGVTATIAAQSVFAGLHAPGFGHGDIHALRARHPKGAQAPGNYPVHSPFGDLELDGEDEGSDEDLFDKRDASTRMSGGTNNEGEQHGPISVPQGAKLTSLPVLGSKKNQIAVFWSERSNNQKATQAFVMIHGRTRNGGDYWEIMENALTDAVEANFPGASNDAIVTAPEFYSTRFNSGQYKKNELAWGDVNAWQAGEVATHPRGTQASSFDVLDAFIAEFANQDKYPNMKNITLVGHGGGGQLMQRYAVLGNNPPSHVHVRYIYGDPSSSVYFTKHRPRVPKSLATKKDCPWFNNWRYGFSNITDAFPDGKAHKTPKEYFAQYVQRDVVAMIGYKDTNTNGGDQYCMAQLQGGRKRRNRNLAYWKYINLLARTNFDLTGFNAKFGPLPDWSDLTGHAIAHRLLVVESARHSAKKVFGSEEGRAALFSSGDLPTGWRPEGWNPKGTGQYDVYPVDSVTKPGAKTVLGSFRNKLASGAQSAVPSNASSISSSTIGSSTSTSTSTESSTSRLQLVKSSSTTSSSDAQQASAAASPTTTKDDDDVAKNNNASSQDDAQKNQQAYSHVTQDSASASLKVSLSILSTFILGILVLL